MARAALAALASVASRAGMDRVDVLLVLVSGRAALLELVVDVSAGAESEAHFVVLS